MKDKISAVRARGIRAIEAMKKPVRSSERGLFSKLAEEAGLSQSQLRQAVKFANTFTDAELKEFLTLRTPGGDLLSISLLYRIMFIPQRRQRAMIARLAAAGNWSAREVESEVQRRFGVDEKARKGGRKPRLPANLAEAMRQLQEKCDQWQRWVGQLEVRDEEPDVFSARQLPQILRKRINVVTSAMNELARGVAELDTAKLR